MSTQAGQEVVLDYTAFPLTHQIHLSPKRFRVLCCGRRFGKSTFGLAALFEILCQARTKDPRAIVVAPTFGKVEEDWRIARQLFGPSHLGPGVITDSNENDYRLFLGSLGEMDFRSADAQGGAARGAGYNGALLDEAAYISNEVWETDIRPALSDRLGRALFLSTPNGTNWFSQLYATGREHPDYQSWRYSTMEGWASRYRHDPVMLSKMAQEWEDIQRTTSERKFQQEYLAQFLEEEGALWQVSNVLRGNLRGPLPGRHYVAGLDVAAAEDWMVTAVVEVESAQLVGLYRSQHRSWTLQKQAAGWLLRQYPNVRVLIDSTGVGDPIAQDMRAEGFDVEDVVFSSKRKSELVEQLSIVMDHGKIGIPDTGETQWLLQELRSYQETRLPSGHLRYAAPSGQHDDGVTALMLAVWGMRFEMTDLLAPELQDFTYDRWEQVQQENEWLRRKYPNLSLHWGHSSMESLSCRSM